MDNIENKSLIILEKCPQCGRATKEEWYYCPYCNHKMTMIDCVSCKKEIKQNWIYCPYCKTRVKQDNLTKELFKDTNEWLIEVLNKEALH